MPSISQVQERVLQSPFQVGATGSIGFVTDPNVAAAQEIKAVLMTFRGERLLRPNFGNPYSMQVFSTSLDQDSDFITMQLMQAMQQQVTRSTIDNVDVSQEGGGSWSINVQYTPKTFSSLQQAVSIPVAQ